MNINFNKLLKSSFFYADKFKKILWTLGASAFSLIILIILLEVMFGGILYYKYVFLAENQEPKISESPLQFKENAYQYILIEWQKRGQKFESYSQKDYLSPL